MSSPYCSASRLTVEGREIEIFLQRVDGAAAGKRQACCLLLHGNPGSLLDWQPLAAELKRVTDVAAVDLPGFGRSPRPAAGARQLGLECLADHVVAVADALGWHEPIVLVGHSHGGGVAQMVAARHPTRIAGLVLLGTLGTPAHASYRLLSLPGAKAVAWLGKLLFRARALKPLSRAVLRGVMADIFAPERVSTARVDSELALLAAQPHVLESMVDVTRGRPCAKLAGAAALIRCPVSFLHGQHDALVPQACARNIHDGIIAAGGRSTFEVLAGAGHMLIGQRPADVAQHITAFLSAAELR